MKRIQRKRTKGWQMPEDAIYVGRPTRWGNPWRVVPVRRTWMDRLAHRNPYAVVHSVRGSSLGTFASEERARYWAVQGFRKDFAEDIEPLRGHDLVCWCPLCPAHADGLPLGVSCPDCPPCHADVLLTGTLL